MENLIILIMYLGVIGLPLSLVTMFLERENKMALITWKPNTRKYVPGVIGYLGKWPVMAVGWDSCCSTNGKPYKLTTQLPGLKNNLGHYESTNQAKEKASKVANHWLNGSGILTTKKGE